MSSLTSHQDEIIYREREDAKMPVLPLKAYRNGDIIGPKGHKYIGGIINPPTQGLALRGVPLAPEEESSDEGQAGPELADFTTDEDDDDE
jgi:hypothetical protein